MDRRRFVKLAGMASVAATTGLAGCNGGGGDDGTEDGGNGDVSGGETARYSDWITEESVASGQLLAVSLDTAALQEVGQDQETTAEGSTELQEDALAMTPVSYLFAGALTAGFGVNGLGLGDFLSEGSPTEKVHVAGGGIIFEGAYDANEVGTSVENAGASEAGAYSGYTLYTKESQQGNTTVAVGSDTIIVVNESPGKGVTDTESRAKHLVDATNGDATSYSDAESAFGDLMDALPNRAIMGVTYSSDGGALESQNNSSGSFGDYTTLPDTDLEGNVLGYANSADVTSDSMTSSVALRYENEEEVDDKSTIESALGNKADDRSINIDGPLVVVEASYETTPSTE